MMSMAPDLGQKPTVLLIILPRSQRLLESLLQEGAQWLNLVFETVRITAAAGRT